MFQFPTRDIDRPDTLVGFLGTHWSEAFDARDQIRSLMLARSLEEQQKVRELRQVVDAVSRFTQPLHRTEQWRLLVLKENERNHQSVAVLRYGDSKQQAVYGTHPVTGRLYRYGMPHETESVFPLPYILEQAPFIFDRIVKPSRTLTYGLDYYLSPADQAIVFRKNPFDSPQFEIRELFEDGVLADRECWLWLFRPQRDRDRVYRQFGYVTDLKLPSSLQYRDYVNAVWDGVVAGASSRPLAAALAALTDTPVATGHETVQHVVGDSRGLLITTDKAAYRYPSDATALVTAGDVVEAGDQLVDTVRVFEFHNGDVPAVGDLQALELGRGFLPAGFVDGISFFNQDVPLQVDTSGEFTRVEFEVGGFDEDVTRFWTLFHERGEASPPTLAQLLDRRENPSGEPTAGALPATVNPLEFLIRNVLRNNAFVVKIKHRQQGSNRLPFSAARKLRLLVPPHTAMLLVFELVFDPDTVNMDGPGDDQTTGYEESPGLGFGLEPFAETLDVSALAEDGPRVRYTTQNC